MPNPIEEDADLAAAVGRVTSLWAHLEHHFAALFSILTGMDLTMSVTVFNFFRSVRTQRDVILSVAKVSDRANEATIENITAILLKYDQLSFSRNTVVHTPFGYEPADDQLYRMERAKISRPGIFPYKKTPFSVEDVNDLIEPIRALTLEVVALHNSILNKAILAKVLSEGSLIDRALE